MTKLPTFDQVMKLPALVEATISPDYIDANGHMNIRHYLELGTSSVVVICEDVGIDDTDRTQRRMECSPRSTISGTTERRGRARSSPSAPGSWRGPTRPLT